MSNTLIEDRAEREEREKQREEDRIAKAEQSARSIMPYPGRLLLRSLEAGNPSSTLWTGPEAAQRSMLGLVVAAGADCRAKVGQRVIVAAFAGIKFDLQNVPHLMIKEEDVQGLVHDPEVQVIQSEN